MSSPARTTPSAAPSVVLTTTTRLRDAAVIVATLVAVTVQGFAELWFSLALAVVAGASWITVRRTPIVRRTRIAARQRGLEAGRSVADAGRIVQADFLVLGASLVWRLDFRLLPLAVLGVWALVCAADLDRLAQRFPLASPPRDQRALIHGHLRALAVVAAVSAVAVGAAALIRIELRLATVMLLTLFVVVVVLRVARESTQTREEPREEPRDGGE